VFYQSLAVSVETQIHAERGRTRRDEEATVDRLSSGDLAGSAALPRISTRRCRVRSVARQPPPHQRSANLVVVTSVFCRAIIHDVVQMFNRVMTIDTTKNISFKNKKPPMLDLKIVLKKILKLKKNRYFQGFSCINAISIS